MIYIDPTWETAVSADSRAIKIKATINETTYTGEDDLLSLSYTDSLDGSTGISMGVVSMSSVSLKIYNHSIAEGAVVTPWIGLDVSGTVKWCPLGKFIASSVSSSDHGFTQDIVAYDLVTRLSGIYAPTVSFPASASDVLDDIAEQCVITLSEAITWPYGVPTLEKPYSATCRDYVGWIAGLCGKNARFNRDGELEFAFYPIDQTDYYEIPTSRKYIGETDENAESVTISSITAINGGSEITAGTGRGITFTNPYATQSILEDILDDVNGLEFVPLRCKWRGNPALQSGDGVAVEHKDGSTSYAVVMEQRTVVNGGMFGEISCYGASDTTYKMNTSPTEMEIKRTYTALKQAIADASALIDGAKGGIFTVTDGNGDGINDGFLIADNPDISLAQNVIKANYAGIGISKTGIGGSFVTAITGDGINASAITGGVIDGDVVKARNLLVQGFQLDPEPESFATEVDLERALLDVIYAQEPETMITFSAIYTGLYSPQGLGLVPGLNVFNLYKHEYTIDGRTLETTFITDNVSGVGQGALLFSQCVKNVASYDIKRFTLSPFGIMDVTQADSLRNENKTAAVVSYANLYKALDSAKNVNNLVEPGWYYEVEQDNLSAITGLPTVSGSISTLSLEVSGHLPYFPDYLSYAGLFYHQKLTTINTSGDVCIFSRTLAPTAQTPYFGSWNKIYDSAKTPSIVDTSKSFTSSTSIAYTGLSVTIPANSEVNLRFRAVYNNGQPQAVLVSRSSTAHSAYQVVAESDAGAECTVGGIFKTQTTLYFWARYNNATSNTSECTGTIRAI